MPVVVKPSNLKKLVVVGDFTKPQYLFMKLARFDMSKEKRNVCLSFLVLKEKSWVIFMSNL